MQSISDRPDCILMPQSHQMSKFVSSDFGRQSNKVFACRFRKTSRTHNAVDLNLRVSLEAQISKIKVARMPAASARLGCTIEVDRSVVRSNIRWDLRSFLSEVDMEPRIGRTTWALIISCDTSLNLIAFRLRVNVLASIR